jgi:hypothetical protein
MQKLKSSFNSTRRRLAERAFQAAGIHESSIGEDVRKQLLFLLSNFLFSIDLLIEIVPEP